MRTLLAVLTLALLASLLPTGDAGHTCCTCPTYTTSPTLPLGTAVGANEKLQLFVTTLKGNFYLVYDGPSPDKPLQHLWVYQETNGDGGLQRHDASCYTPGYNSEGARDLILW